MFRFLGREVGDCVIISGFFVVVIDFVDVVNVIFWLVGLYFFLGDILIGKFLLFFFVFRVLFWVWGKLVMWCDFFFMKMLLMIVGLILLWFIISFLFFDFRLMDFLVVFFCGWLFWIFFLLWI